MKGVRSFLVLLVVAAALGGYLYYDSKHEPGDEKKQEKVYPGVVADKIERVTVKSASGAETTVSRYSGCNVELWTIHGGGHVPNFQPSWGETFYGFLAAHPKP